MALRIFYSERDTCKLVYQLSRKYCVLQFDQCDEKFSDYQNQADGSV